MAAMTSVRRVAGLVLAVAVLASGCANGGDTSAAGDPAPGTSTTVVPAVLDFTAETVGGEPFDGAGLAGKPTVLWFWAPWCPTCRAQISGVGELAATHGSAVNVVGVGALDDPGAIEDFAAGVSPDVTVLTDPEGAVWRQLGVTAQSTYLVLDAAGTEQASGYLDDAELAELVSDLVD